MVSTPDFESGSLSSNLGETTHKFGVLVELVTMPACHAGGMDSISVYPAELGSVGAN